MEPITKPITYEQAREISIWVWKQRAKGKHIDHSHILNKFDTTTTSQCGFCEYYLNSPYKGCEECPLWWEHAEAENNSTLNPYSSRNCTRNYWKWNFYKPDDRWKIHWAKKLLEQLEATPEHEPERDE